VVANPLLAAAVLAADRPAFIVVGGCAMRLHGLSHQPSDLDIVPEPSRANVHLLFHAFDVLGTVRGTVFPTLHTLESRDVVTVISTLGPVDVMFRTARNEYKRLARAAAEITIGDTAVTVAALDEVLRLRARYREVASGV
jgi:hypothetical protein